MSELLDSIYNQAKQATEELCEKAKLKEGNIVIIGCSSSEVTGELIGTHSSLETAEAVFKGIYEVLSSKNIYLAAQCCEHLNRAIIVERAAVPLYDDVNVIPQPKAGGSFATTAYKTFKEPVAVEHIKADAGLDIGGTLIGMHLKEVAVPLRLSLDHIGNAILLAARTRPKFIGVIRAGMHLKEVAVPLRLSLDHIGNAILLAARTRPKFIGGIRATYNEDLL